MDGVVFGKRLYGQSKRNLQVMIRRPALVEKRCVRPKEMERKGKELINTLEGGIILCLLRHSLFTRTNRDGKHITTRVTMPIVASVERYIL